MYNLKKIIIVGGTGFLGYHLSLKCIKNKWQVISLSRKKPKPFRTIKKVNYQIVDTSNKKKLNKILKKINNIDYVVNLSGEVDHKNKKKVFSSHYKGSINLSNILLKKKIKKFIQIGSSMEYGKLSSPQIETTKVKPVSNYGKAKALATNFFLKLHANYSFPVIILRPYQVYGTHQYLNRFIPIVVQNCIQDKTFPCSNGKQSRDFLYIDDFINCIMKCLAKKNITGQIFNIGYGKSNKILNIINLIKKKCDRGKPLLGHIKLRNEENLITYPNIKKAYKLLRWKPKTKFENGLKKTISFYKKNILK